MAAQVVLGLGGCIDYELSLSAATLGELIDEYGIDRSELTGPGPISSERDLLISVLRYLATGGGGEHFVASTAIIDAFSSRFTTKVAVGGTSVRAGIVMSRLGVPSTLHLVSVNDHVRALLPPDSTFISSGGHDTLYPHLIVQYGRNLRVRARDVDIRTPFPNRIIYVNDPANENLVVSDHLGELLRSADVFLISGLNAVRDPDVLDRRLLALRRHMGRLPAGAVVYFEDAAYHEPSFSRRVITALEGLVDIHGLNEDEMRAHVGHPVDLLSVSEVEHALADLRTVIRAPVIVVHTQFWSLAVGDGAETYGPLLDAGMSVATARYAYGDACADEQYAEIAARPDRTDAALFATELQARMGGVVCCRPGREVDVFQPTTVGLGDAFVGGFLAAVAKRRCSARAVG